MKATIRSLNTKEFDEEMESLRVPGVNGEIEILPGHAMSFFVLKKGLIKAKSKRGRIKKIDISEGVCWVDKNVIVLFSRNLKSGNN